jgi:hypothetical protein
VAIIDEFNFWYGSWEKLRVKTKKMDDFLVKAKEALDHNRLDEAKLILDEILAGSPLNIEAFLLRSQLFHKLQAWGDSINDLNRVLEIEPDHKVAKNYKSMVLQIIRYWNKDSYNP